MELFATGLENGTRTNLFSPADQRAALETYRTRWERLEHAERVSLNTNDHWTTILDPLIIYQVAANNKYDFCFLQAPSPSKGLPQKEWVIRDLPGKPRCAAVQPAHDLLVMVESRPGPNEFMCVINRGPTTITYLLAGITSAAFSYRLVDPIPVLGVPLLKRSGAA